MTSVFLSHNSKDKAFARKLASMLSDSSVEVWIDEAELKVGDSLAQKIGSAIEKTDFLAVVLSHSSVNSPWVQKELALAMQKELAERRVTVLPILKESCEIPAFLRDKIYADFTDPTSYEAPFARLLHPLGIEKPAYEKPKEKVTSTSPPLEQSHEELEGFLDIRILNVDKEKTYNPNPEKALYNVYFRLSEHPPSEWVEIFDAERQFPRHNMWRRAWVEGKFVGVYCVPEEVKRYHLRDIKQDVETCNEKYRQYLHREGMQKAREAKKENEEKNALNSALDGLDL
ncbi:MAG: toll/interleukin-1 receptor domain-containing protein [Gammaproteobacteria bacterium]